MENAKHNIAILIPTKNRAEYVIRQLQYYAKVQCPYSVYIGDSSNSENSLKIQKAIEDLKNAITVHYFCKPEFNYCQATIHLLSLPKEEYICMIGDDDFQIPASLAKCAEFLDTHKDYVSAHGYSVAIRLVGNAAYGKIGKIKDYPQPQYEQDLAKDRLLNFFQQYYVSHFSVVRAEVMKYAWSRWQETPERAFSEEILDATLIVVMGKSKLIDCLSFIRQIHDHHYGILDTYSWLTQKNWNESYLAYEKILSQELATLDTIDVKTAQNAVRQGFWSYLNIQLPLEYKEHFEQGAKKPSSMRKKVLELFPFSKTLYKKIKPFITKKRWIHAEVIDPKSSYYRDFQKIIEACSDTHKT